jgi:cytochrome c oxidase cbb3-type subunit 3
MIKEYKEDLAKVESVRAPFEEKIAAMTAEEILADQELTNYVVGSSKVLFGDNCAACHGAGGNPAAGSGYPNLADDDWLYGGSVYDIAMSIANGRQGMMPAHGAMLSESEVDTLVQFVIDSSNGVTNQAGLALYNSKGCVACHGADASGVKAMGSANLTDKIWRFSGDADEIRKTIVHGVNAGTAETRIAVMPQWSEKYAVMLEAIQYAIEEGEDPNEIDWDEELSGDEAERLTPTEIKKLAVYVHQFGGGQ